MSRTHIAIVGAGFIGITLARALIHRGCRVTVFAPSLQAAGATAVSYEWLNSHRKRPATYQALNLCGLNYWREVFGPRYADHVTWSGHTAIAVSDEHRALLSERVDYLASHEYSAQLTHAPGSELNVPVPTGALVASFADEGYCDALSIRLALLKELQQHELFDFVEATVDAVDDTGVVLADGSRVPVDRTVIAAGNGSADLITRYGASFPMADQTAGGPAWGFLATVSVPAHGIRQLFTGDDLNLRPIDEDTLLVQCLDLDRHAAGDLPDSELTAIGEEFSRRVRRLLGRAVRTLRTRVGHRVIPGDGHTAAGPLRGSIQDRVWAVVTHSGITLGPWLAEVIASELTTGVTDVRLRGFRPTRFTRTSAATAPSPRMPGEQ
ncbi:FAD-binding oxidoreductase [Leucobacter sp. gxy201]|uniref:NAD(P)/FAD-dependent oxidoreductase n=1 Tax=Leucobacter sp. gxy201 TaxID=2957200 RepID=UPI003DA0DB20